MYIFKSVDCERDDLLDLFQNGRDESNGKHLMHNNVLEHFISLEVHRWTCSVDKVSCTLLYSIQPVLYVFGQLTKLLITYYFL